MPQLATRAARQRRSSSGSRGTSLGSFDSTAYGPPWGGIQGTGTTATGIDLHASPHYHIVAVDPAVIPLGSILIIQPNPFSSPSPFLAADTGGAIKGRRIDFYDWRGRSKQYAWGTRSVHVARVGNADPSHPLSHSILAGLDLPYSGPGLPGLPGLPNPFDIPNPFGDPLGSLAGIVDAVKNIGEFFIALGQLLLTPEGWLRMGKVLLGLIALTWGLNLLVKRTTGVDPIGSARKIAGTAITAAAVA